MRNLLNFTLSKLLYMKTALLYIVFICAGAVAFAKPVDEATANKTGLNFLINNTKNAFKTSYALTLAYKSISNTNGSNTVYYYVFNADHGFVIVAGDDQAIPILGYSDEGTFSTNNIPAQVSEWLNGYTNQMKYIVANNIAATPEISSKWSALINSGAVAAPQQTTSGGTPLLATTWDQLPYYNDDCPYDNTAQRHAVTGCVATAMAQVMKFWNYPATGIGFHSYSDPTYGTQSASFGATAYQWTSMPNNVTSTNAAVATLMYQCGVSVNMTYGVSESDAYVLASQSPQPNCAENALKTYFAYDKSLHGVLRSNYSSDAAWIDTIEAEINAGRPVIYTGTGSGGGHCFVCDGYQSSNNYLHINWGWSGIYDGYFPIDGLNPGTGGTGAGSGSYNSDEQAIIGIKPSTAFLSYNIGLNSALSLSSTTVLYQNDFSVSANITNINSNSHNFMGDFCVEVFDSSNNLIDSSNIDGQSLNVSQNTGNISFTVPAIASLLPGVYMVQVFYRPNGGSWSIVVNNGYSNQAQVKIYWSNALELSAPIVISPKVPTQNNSITVKLNVKNTGLSFVNKYIFVRLYDLDGYGDFLVGHVNISLDPDSSFAGGLTFTNPMDTVSPGTYLVVAYSATDSIGIGGFALLGSTYYQNPVKVTIAAPPLPPDQYEPDNTVDSAYTFTPTFTNDSAEIKTVGANINTGSDVDYYRINVPAGYYYTFNAILYGLLYPSDSQTYTLDGIFSFTVDSGTTWSETYQSTTAGTNAYVNGPGSMIFQVAPIFPGATGTYLLDIKISKTVGSSIAKTPMPANLIKVYPNPATDVLNIDYSNIEEGIKQLSIIDIAGKQVFASMNPGGKTASQISVTNYPGGLYFLQLETDNGVINKQISIVR